MLLSYVCPRLPTPTQVVRHTSSFFAQYAYSVEKLPELGAGLSALLDDAIGYAVMEGLCAPGVEVVVVHGAYGAVADVYPQMELRVAPGVSIFSITI
jgi:hypothetical protein